MPRYYRRRYTRVVRPKKKWASNMQHVEYDSTTAGPNQSAITFTKKAAAVFSLCANSAQGDSPTPVILKTGNFKTQLDCIVAAGDDQLSYVKSTVYIMYIPEGVWLSGVTTPEQEFEFYAATIARHPEWIIAWKLLGADWSTQSEFSNRVSFSSRLKRNLNSGDRVVLVFFAESKEHNLTQIKIHAVTQFWTCAN